MFESNHSRKPRAPEAPFSEPRFSERTSAERKFSELKFLEPKLPEPKPGALFEGVALTVAAIAFGCVTFADFLSHTVQPTNNSPLAVAQNNAKSVRVSSQTPAKSGTEPSVDYNATGSIKSVRQALPLNPCEMKTEP